MSPQEESAIEKRARRAAKVTGRPYAQLLSELAEKHQAEREDAERKEQERLERLHSRADMGYAARLFGAVGVLAGTGLPLWVR